MNVEIASALLLSLATAAMSLTAPATAPRPLVAPLASDAPPPASLDLPVTRTAHTTVHRAPAAATAAAPRAWRRCSAPMPLLSDYRATVIVCE